MATVFGRVRAGTQPLRDLVVEAFAVPLGFGELLPVSGAADLSRYKVQRLGSAVTGSTGQFRIEYDEARAAGGWFARKSVNLWLLITDMRARGEGPTIVYQAPTVRRHAAATEEYLVVVDDSHAQADDGGRINTEPPPEAILQGYAKQRALQYASLQVASDRFATRARRHEDFQLNVAPRIRAALSNVPRDESGQPTDPEFTESDRDIERHSKQRMQAAIALNMDARLEDHRKLVLRGRISLTSRLLEALEVGALASTDVTITVDEDTLARALSEDGTGRNPETSAQIVNRVETIVRFCRDQQRDYCLDEPPAPDVDDPDHGEPDDSSDEPEPRNGGSGDTGLVGANVTLETLKESMPSYIAAVLDESTLLDPGHQALPSPGHQLTEASISGQAVFPSLTLPPGPADVPALHDFYDLQIAFKPVWQEALDESLLGNAEALYDHYVESGGDGGQFFGLVFEALHLNVALVQVAVDVLVQKYIEITNEEWRALNQDQRNELHMIAVRIDGLFAALGHMAATVQAADFGNIDAINELVAKAIDAKFPNIREYFAQQVRELEDQGQRFVRIARQELENQAAGKLQVPNSNVLNQLRSRAASAYPAKYFAANTRQRSVNFGILLNYRQRWTPTAYQVGELIKSIPLAPKEVRKFSKKVIRKERRARKEIESNLESLKSETSSTTRAEAEIVQKAMDKTNFNASANGSFTVGVWSGGGSSALTQDAESNSAETKKSFHEAVVKAAREYKNELKIELDTETTDESEYQESGELVNPNDELTVTYLFYELQRRYRVEERLHRITSVVLVAQEMPNPGSIDEDWLIAHRWILNRVLLDDSFKQPLAYVAEGMVAEQFALEEMRKTLAQQRRLVEELKEDVSESRDLSASRYAALQRTMERTARAAQRSKKGGGLLGMVRKLTSPPVIGDLVDRFIGDSGESPEAARVREAAAQDAYQREVQYLRDIESQLAQTNASLNAATEAYTDRLATHLASVVRVTELKNHIKDNITHYMQAIWVHEPFQQRWLRLKDVPVPLMKRPAGVQRRYVIDRSPVSGSLANVAHLRTRVHEFATFPDLEVAPVDPRPGEPARLETVPLYQVADIDDLLGFRANYMIFPMRAANPITEFMMEPYVEKAAGAFGITDPDDLGNMSLDEFADYVCCLRKHLSADEFSELRDELLAQLKKLLQSPLRDDEEIVVPMNAMYIEALPGATPVLENFKLLHRQIDAADAQEGLRLKKMEKLRYAQRLLEGRMDDPKSDARYVFTSSPDLDFSVHPPAPGGGGP